MSQLFATVERAYHLPPQALTAAAVYSVPRPSGGYDYYRAPPGSALPLNDDFPLPSIAHPNPVGVSSLTIGRDLPPGSVHVGTGMNAIGSITPMPGAGEGEIASLVALGDVGDGGVVSCPPLHDDDGPRPILLGLAAVTAMVASYWIVRHWSGR